MTKYYTPKLTKAQCHHLLDALDEYEDYLYDAYQEYTDEHGYTIENSNKYKKYKLNKSLYIYLFEYCIKKDFEKLSAKQEKQHGKA